MAARSFAGFDYRDRISVGFFGQVYRGHDPSHREVRLLHVDHELGGLSGFAEALARFGTDLERLSCRNVVGTRAVGRAADGSLVVVTDPVNGPVSVAELLDDAHGAGLPLEVAFAIARGAAAGLAAAHQLSVVHGCLHPRSVLVDLDGNVKVGHFAVGRALASCPAGAGRQLLRDAARGYLAPELSHGAEPSTRSDVYAAAALLSMMLTGGAPLSTSPAIGRLLDRALEHDPKRRYRDAVQLAAAMDTLVEAGSVTALSATKLAHRIRELRAAVDHSLDDSTDDLLSVLATDEAGPGEGGGDPGDIDELLDSLSESEPAPEPEPAPVRGRRDDTPLPAPLVDHDVSLAVPDESVGGATVGRGPSRPPVPDVELPEVALSRGRGWAFWIAVTAAVLGGVLIYLYTQTDVFHPERARREGEQKRKEREAAIRAFNASQPRPGKIEISSQPEGAAVWWKLGRTPLETRPMRADVIHQIRIEYDGHRPRDVDVAAKHWSGSGDTARAIVSVELTRGDRARAPAAPPEPSASLRPGPAGSKGVIAVKSKPSGAEVWLLVGFTGHFDGLASQAGLEYELKVLKKGYQPGYVVVRKQDWQKGSDPGDLHARIERELELTPIAK